MRQVIQLDIGDKEESRFKKRQNSETWREREKCIQEKKKKDKKGRELEEGECRENKLESRWVFEQEMEKNSMQSHSNFLNRNYRKKYILQYDSVHRYYTDTHSTAFEASKSGTKQKLHDITLLWVILSYFLIKSILFNSFKMLMMSQYTDTKIHQKENDSQYE